MKMTLQQLMDNGYTKYRHNDDVNTAIYQKYIRDENGNKQYIINFEEWDFSKYESKDMDNPRYEGTVQLTLKSNGNSINVSTLSGWTLEEAEKFYEELFKLGWFENYENV